MTLCPVSLVEIRTLGRASQHTRKTYCFCNFLREYFLFPRPTDQTTCTIDHHTLDSLNDAVWWKEISFGGPKYARKRCFNVLSPYTYTKLLAPGKFQLKRKGRKTFKRHDFDETSGGQPIGLQNGGQGFNWWLHFRSGTPLAAKIGITPFSAVEKYLKIRKGWR